jgi:hypothetical protein
VSASSEDIQMIEPAFDSFEHLTSLCKGSKVILGDLITIEYPKGWAGLIANFINEIRDVPVRIESMTSDHCHLDVYFTAKLQRYEVRIWRALDEASRRSRASCIECGAYIDHRKPELILCICPGCIKKSGNTRLTGTWLDNYINGGRG